MRSFDFDQPTEVAFGAGRVAEIGRMVARCGKKCLLVTPADADALAAAAKVKKSLQSARVKAAHFDGVQPHAALKGISDGAKKAKAHGADVVLGVGGASAIDTAKAVAVQAAHPGTAWKYVYSAKTQPTAKTLAIVAVPTMPGTVAHVTNVAEVTHAGESCKSMLRHRRLLPRACVVDPELMTSAGSPATAAGGFAAFAAAFESYIHADSTPYADVLAPAAIRLLVRNLPLAVDDARNLEARSAVAWAGTLAGLCVANVGTTLGHALARALCGHFPQVRQGQALAAVYPAFVRHTYDASVERFAAVGRLLNAALHEKRERVAALRCCTELDRFLKRIGLWIGLDDLGVSAKQMKAVVGHCMALPDGKANPRVASKARVRELYRQSQAR